MLGRSDCGDFPGYIDRKDYTEYTDYMGYTGCAECTGSPEDLGFAEDTGHAARIGSVGFPGYVDPDGPPAWSGGAHRAAQGRAELSASGGSIPYNR